MTRPILNAKSYSCTYTNSSVPIVKCAYSTIDNANGMNTSEHNDRDRIENLVAVLDGYFDGGAQHLNVNVLSKEKLRDALENPHLYPNLTLRISGYAVNITSLTSEQRQDILSRTFHDKM